jgi:hypothetical protein
MWGLTIVQPKDIADTTKANIAIISDAVVMFHFSFAEYKLDGKVVREELLALSPIWINLQVNYPEFEMACRFHQQIIHFAESG